MAIFHSFLLVHQRVIIFSQRDFEQKSARWTQMDLHDLPRFSQGTCLSVPGHGRLKVLNWSSLSQVWVKFESSLSQVKNHEKQWLKPDVSCLEHDLCYAIQNLYILKFPQQLEDFCMAPYPLRMSMKNASSVERRPSWENIEEIPEISLETRKKTHYNII